MERREQTVRLWSSRFFVCYLCNIQMSLLNQFSEKIDNNSEVLCTKRNDYISVVLTIKKKYTKYLFLENTCWFNYSFLPDPPIVNALSQQDIIEGRDLSVTCQVTPGNPSATTFYWTNVNNQGFRQNVPTLQLPNIQRTISGSYRCTAENIYSNGEKGTDSQSLVVNVQCRCSLKLDRTD